MRNILALVICVSWVSPCVSASASFSTDKPSPLKLANPRHGRVVHFTGKVQLSGQFLVWWELVNDKPSHLQLLFFPDKVSTGLLPHAAKSGPVKELLFPKADQAASILLDRETAQRILDKEELSARGEATLTIGSFRTVVECDHRWYLAELLSVSKNPQIVAGIRESGRFGC